MVDKAFILIGVKGVICIVAIVSFIFGIFQYKKKKELEKEKFEWEKENKELERRLEKEKFKWEKESEELRRGKEEGEDILKIRQISAAQHKKEQNKMHYCKKIEEDFAHIDLGGLKNPVIKHLEMEKVYVKQQVEYKSPPCMRASKGLKETLKQDFQTAFENLYKEYREQNRPLKIFILRPGRSSGF